MFPKYVEEVFSSPPGIIILECLGNHRDAHNLLKINPFLRASLNLFIRKQDYSFALTFLEKMYTKRTYTHYDKKLKEKFSPKQLENELSKVWLFDLMVFRQVSIGIAGSRVFLCTNNTVSFTQRRRDSIRCIRRRLSPNY